MIRRFGLVSVPALVSVALIGVGCAKPTLVGKWQGNVTVMGKPIPTTLDLKSDNTMTQTTSLPVGTATATGTYKAEGETLSITATDVTVNGQKLPPAAATLIPKEQLSPTFTYKLDGDALALTGSGGSLTLNRVKDEAAK